MFAGRRRHCDGPGADAELRAHDVFVCDLDLGLAGGGLLDGLADRLRRRRDGHLVVPLPGGLLSALRLRDGVVACQLQPLVDRLAQAAREVHDGAPLRDVPAPHVHYGGVV